ncbi:hypothetical protein AB0J52_36560, partial [Spirillospora sp. NPDC049652]
GRAAGVLGRAAAVTAIGVAAIGPVGSGTASASEGDFTYRVGSKEFRLHNAPDGPCHSLPDIGSHFRNFTGTTVEVYRERDCVGRHWYMEPHAGRDGAPDWAWSFRFMP